MRVYGSQFRAVTLIIVSFDSFVSSVNYRELDPVYPKLFTRLAIIGPSGQY